MLSLLGKPVLVDIEVRDGRWPKITAIMRLEEGFSPATATTELLQFDVEEMDKEVYLKMHRDVRSWVSKRVATPNLYGVALVTPSVL
ncbi:MAG: hypothetical protein DRR42_17000 [Gammaproteobacteria bacterium]|nr:MAG: hypothetical protein DRR42_17000 [Gammaproteobacteria bacterium]